MKISHHTHGVHILYTTPDLHTFILFSRNHPPLQAAGHSSLKPERMEWQGSPLHIPWKVVKPANGSNNMHGSWASVGPTEPGLGEGIGCVLLTKASGRLQEDSQGELPQQHLWAGGMASIAIGGMKPLTHHLARFWFSGTRTRWKWSFPDHRNFAWGQLDPATNERHRSTETPARHICLGSALSAAPSGTEVSSSCFYGT